MITTLVRGKFLGYSKEKQLRIIEKFKISTHSERLDHFTRYNFSRKIRRHFYFFCNSGKFGARFFGTIPFTPISE